ncbi:hypothetical protein NWE55_14215 [Myroides albus]|uniref:hypothetical protein n=1 Tax=Myroides albus TaxID=2562892 RepID=UPI002158BA3C|nr:hypothetical protein [Myroides albus]UVD79269.1 hypothetical protein NWE55_14215 [Myroides albus]
MIKSIGKGLSFVKKYLTKENLELLGKQLENFGSIKIFDFEDEYEDCEVLYVEFLDVDKLKQIFKEYGAKEYENVVILKGNYDSDKDQRVYFIQKLNGENKQVNEYEILCVYTTNVDSQILKWFANKDMVLIKK